MREEEEDQAVACCWSGGVVVRCTSLSSSYPIWQRQLQASALAKGA